VYTVVFNLTIFKYLDVFATISVTSVCVTIWCMRVRCCIVCALFYIL